MKSLTPIYTFGGDGPVFDVGGGASGAGALSAQGNRRYDVSRFMREAPRMWEQMFSGADSPDQGRAVGLAHGPQISDSRLVVLLSSAPGGCHDSQEETAPQRTSLRG